MARQNSKTKQPNLINKCFTFKTRRAMIITDQLDVTRIEPKRKHATIFECFDALEGGEGFVIENDHDPKPLYYQLQGERGNIFTWEYLKQGPDRWHVKIAKLHPAEHGEKSGLQKNKEETEKDPAEGLPPSHEYEKWPLSFLTDYITHTHHRYADENAPTLPELIRVVAERHENQFPDLRKLADTAGRFFTKVREHTKTAESEIFPVIRSLTSGRNREESEPKKINEEELILRQQKELENTEEDLRTIRALTDHYQPPEDACDSWKYMYQRLKDFDADWNHHIHIERRVLFPRTLNQLKRMSSG